MLYYRLTLKLCLQRQVICPIQFRNMLSLKSGDYPNVVALWAAGSYLMDHWPHLSKLLIISPERTYGKTTAFETTEASVCKWEIASSITPGEICRYIQKELSNLLIDEAHRIIKIIRASGHSKYWPKLSNCHKNFVN